jgi:hypothetical protein
MPRHLGRGRPSEAAPVPDGQASGWVFMPWRKLAIASAVMKPASANGNRRSSTRWGGDTRERWRPTSFR